MMLDHSQAPVSGPSPYGQRHFAMPPGRVEARLLLDAIASGVCLAEPQVPDKPLFLYGAGDLGRMAREYFAALGIPIALVVDRNADALRDDPFWQGIALAHPDAVPAGTKRHARILLCVSTLSYKAMEQALCADGWGAVVPFYDVAESQRDRHPLSNGWFAGPLAGEEVERTAAILDGWEDDVSRAHHLQFLAWRLLRQEWTFDGAPVTREDRFFIPEVLAGLGSHAHFVDAGAHHGHVMESLAVIGNGDFGAIVAIEPDDGNVAILEATRARLDPDAAARVEIVRCTLDAEERDRFFHAGLGYASQFSVTGRAVVRSRTLDSLDLAPDFIKLHLEGGELDALRGGEDTIRRHRPILALTTYHDANGIWRTPAWLMDKLDGYRFLMRLHGWCGTGAVVYAIPQERA